MNAAPYIALAALCCVVGSTPVPAQDLRAPVAAAPGAPQVPPAAPNVTVAFRLPLRDGEAVELLRLGRSAADRPWQVAEVARRTLVNGAVALQAPVGLETLLIVRIPGEDGYLLDGPFSWPHRPAAYTVPIRWRRTVRGGWPRQGAAAPVWVSADLRSDASEPWPKCAWSTADRWECVGVPLDAAGVVVSTVRADVVYALAHPGRAPGGIEESSAAAAPWARLLIAAATGNPNAALAEVTLAVNRVEVPRARPQALRVRAVADGAIRVERLGGEAFWVTGSEVKANSWIEMSARGRAPARIVLREVAGAPAEFPLRIDLEPALAIFGRVTAGAGMPAPGAIVSLFRLVPDPVLPDKRPPKRLLVADHTTDDEGAYRFGDLGMEKYELLALHPTLGRADRWIEPDGQEVELPLQRPAQAIGRVLRGGTPAAGVPVRVVPDLAAFAAAEDATELAGGETRSDSDGRFVIALSAHGGGELRVGGERDSVRRVPLPAADAKPRLINVGDIEIGAETSSVSLVLEGSEGCDLMLAGPEGRAGLSVVRAVRMGPAMFEADIPEPGRWTVVAVCGGRERAVVPGKIDVKGGAGEVVVRLGWPR